MFENVTRLSPFVVLQGDASGLFYQIHVYTFLNQPYDILPYLKIFYRRARDCDLETGIQAAHRLVLAGWHDVEMFAVPR